MKTSEVGISVNSHIVSNTDQTGASREPKVELEDLVTIKNETVPSFKYMTARIVCLYSGADYFVRTLEVILHVDIDKLCQLPVDFDLLCKRGKPRPGTGFLFKRISSSSWKASK